MLPSKEKPDESTVLHLTNAAVEAELTGIMSFARRVRLNSY